MHKLTLHLKTPQDTLNCGEMIGRYCRLPLVIALNGNLGAGKTAFSQGVGIGFGIQEHLTSPSFALIHEYENTRGKLYHLDVYRMSSMDELLDLDFESILSGENHLLLIEWQNKFSAWPDGPDCLEIELQHRPKGRQAIVKLPESQSYLLEHFQPWLS